jgi:hypothetical protein
MIYRPEWRKNKNKNKNLKYPTHIGIRKMQKTPLIYPSGIKGDTCKAESCMVLIYVGE